MSEVCTRLVDRCARCRRLLWHRHSDARFACPYATLCAACRRPVRRRRPVAQ